jgi:hypothetical protein
MKEEDEEITNGVLAEGLKEYACILVYRNT